MKKIILAGIILAIASFALGVKSKGVLRRIHISTRGIIGQQIINTSYKQVSCPEDGITIATFGQSNSANYVKPLSTNEIPKNLFQYDWRTGKCYEYKEPLLGTTGTNGNVITYTAIKIARDTSNPVVVIPFGVGGTSVLEWAFGSLSYQQDLALSSIKQSGLSPRIFLWHQGESDARINDFSPDDLKKIPAFKKPQIQLGLSRDSYTNALEKIVEKTNQYFPKSYFGIALVSRCSNRNQWEPIRTAQQLVANSNDNTFISADSDIIYSELARYDKCHFSKEGAEELGNQYYDSISNLLK